jgi:mevalonate kinase
MSSIETIRGNGKLLITGEYVVLDGAAAIAIPCRFGQDISFKSISEIANSLHWVSLDMYGFPWFEGVFDKSRHEWSSCSDQETGELLIEIFNFCKKHSLRKWEKLTEVESIVDFPLDWGLGTSSTLIYSIAKHFDIDGFELNKQVFKGSGYDIACAGVERPIKFSLTHTGQKWENVDWQPEFQEQLAFVYLGTKQSSQEEIDRYNGIGKVSDQYIEEISQISNEILNPFLSLDQFVDLIRKHENLISQCINKSSIQDLYFSDFEGAVKSLGAWGGDFAMAVFKNEADYSYFYKRGFPNVIPFSKMIYDSFVRFI